MHGIKLNETFTLDRTLLDVRIGAWQMHLIKTTHKTHKRQAFLRSAGFEPAISASVQPQTYVLDGSVTRGGINLS